MSIWRLVGRPRLAQVIDFGASVKQGQLLEFVNDGYANPITAQSPARPAFDWFFLSIVALELLASARFQGLPHDDAELVAKKSPTCQYFLEVFRAGGQVDGHHVVVHLRALLTHLKTSDLIELILNNSLLSCAQRSQRIDQSVQSEFTELRPRIAASYRTAVPSLFLGTSTVRKKVTLLSTPMLELLNFRRDVIPALQERNKRLRLSVRDGRMNLTEFLLQLFQPFVLHKRMTFFRPLILHARITFRRLGSRSKTCRRLERSRSIQIVRIGIQKLARGVKEIGNARLGQLCRLQRIQQAAHTSR